MRRRARAPALALVALFSLSPLAIVAPARADDHGFVLGARTGYGLAYGTTYETRDGGSRSFAGSYNGMVPLFVEAGYRVGKLAFGPFFQYAFVLPTPSACPSELSCSVSDIRFGATADYHFTTRTTWDPWVGIGIGYEWTSYHASGATTRDETLSGLELVDVEGGFDFALSKALRAGGFLMVSLAQFTSFDTTIDGAHASGQVATDIGKPTPHGWVILGGRVRFDL